MAPTSSSESEDPRLSVLAKALPNAMLYQVVLGDDGSARFTYVSDNIERIHGVTVEAALADATVLYDQVLPEYRPALRAAESRALRDRTPFQVELPCRLPDGEVRWFELNSAPNLLPDGRLAWDGVELDITARKQAEEAVRVSQERFRSFFETAVVGAVQVDPQTGRFLAVNDRYCQITGYSREELLNLTFLDITHAEDRKWSRERFEEWVRGERGDYHFEKRYTHKDGRDVWVLVSMAVIRDAQGRAVLASGVVQDATDRKTVEQSAARTDEQRQLALEAANLGTWDYDLVTGDVFWDERTQAIFGCTGDKIEYDRVLELIHPDDRAQVDQAVSAALLSDSPGAYEAEYRVCWPDGSVHCVSARGQAFFEGQADQRRAVRFLGTVMDITERRRAEEALREGEENFRTLADNIAQFAWMADETGWIFWYNKRWHDYTGTTLEDVQGWRWQKVHHPDHVTRVVEKFKHSVETGTVWEDTFPLRGRDGAYRWFLSQAVPIRDSAGRVLRWFGTNTDVTAQREAEQRLRESRALYRTRLAELQTIYKSAPIGLCVIDREFRFVRINDQFASLNGLAAAEHIGRTLRDVVPDLADKKEPILRQVIETGQPVIGVEISGTTRAMPGITRYWVVNFFPLLDDSGEIVGVNVTAQEITDRKRAEQQRQALLEAEQAARSELERYNRLKDEFLATVSHELRSPLNAILGWTRLLAQGKAESGRALEIVERNASGLAQIVEDLLDMSRIISGKIHLVRTSADVAPLAAGVMECIHLAAEAKGISLQTWIDPRLRPISCDPNRVRQIIWNLLTNAVKFTPAGGKVWLNLEQVESQLVITVKDTGQGISPEFLPHVFGRFQQADSSITRKHGGLGLGLAIAKHLVELHGGTIQVHSEGENKGSTFTVRLPSGFEAVEEAPVLLARQSREAMARRGDADLTDVLSGLTVVVVDDDPDSCELAGRVLREAGADVHFAHSAERGFDLLMDVRPDVLISDISMPQQDGYAFIRKIRSCGGWCADLVCIALTALARAEDRVNILAAGYNEYVSKPFDAAVLPVLISQLAVNPREAGLRLDSEMTSGEPISRDDQRTANSRHILLAEDNTAISEMLRLFLEGSGYRVSVAPTVEQAVAVGNADPADLLLSDLRLKDGTGWELMERLRQIRPVPGVMLSGYSDSYYIEKSKSAGFARYLVKPVEEEQLLEAIRDVLAAS